MGIFSGGGGGAAAPTTHEAFLAGANTSVPDNGSVDLPWGLRDSGTVLLDRTVPAAPTVITAGVYACTVRVIGFNMTAGGHFTPTLNFDNAGADQFVFTDCNATAGNPSPSVSLSLTYYCPAAAQIVVNATNLDGGGSSIQFSITSAYLQRIA